eukprot:1179976-Prorocentrum_minimum.AAC.2
MAQIIPPGGPNRITHPPSSWQVNPLSKASWGRSAGGRGIYSCDLRVNYLHTGKLIDRSGVQALLLADIDHFPQQGFLTQV